MVRGIPQLLPILEFVTTFSMHKLHGMGRTRDDAQSLDEPIRDEARSLDEPGSGYGTVSDGWGITSYA